MAIKIGSNISSTQSIRRLDEATSSLSAIYERLSSGQRINKASDDSAGLAIADDLKAKSRIFGQAIRNGNDGISLLNIADSTIDSLSGIITRIRELAEQSANGSYSDTQRRALDAEAQALSKEFTRIKSSASFNGVKLFDGTLGQGLTLQLGLGTEQSLKTSMGGAIGTGTLGSGITHYGGATEDSLLADLNNDGILDLLNTGGGYASASIRMGIGGGIFGSAVNIDAGMPNVFGVAVGDLNGDGILDLAISGYNSISGGAVTLHLGTGNGSFVQSGIYTTEDRNSSVQLKDVDKDGILDLITAGYSGSHGIASVRLGTGKGSFGSMATYTTADSLIYSTFLTLEDLNNDGNLDIITAGDGYSTGAVSVLLGAGNGSFGKATYYTSSSYAVSFGDLNNDGIIDMVAAGTNGSSGIATVRLGTGNGIFGSAQVYTTESGSSRDIALGDMNGDGNLDIVTAGYGATNGNVTIRLGSGNGTFADSRSFGANSYNFSLALGDLNSDGVLDVAVGGSDGGSAMTVKLGNYQDGISSLQTFSLKTRTDALLAMRPMELVQERLAKQRGTIGANQSRIGVAISNLISSKENFLAAESRIRDTDIAADSANLVRTQILQKAAGSVLAQANQSPQLVLMLLS